MPKFCKLNPRPQLYLRQEGFQLRRILYLHFLGKGIDKLFQPPRIYATTQYGDLEIVELIKK